MNVIVHYHPWSGESVHLRRSFGDDRTSGADWFSPLPHVTICDLIIIYCPFTRKTRNNVRRRASPEIKRGCYRANCECGEICDEKAIVCALESGRLAG